MNEVVIVSAVRTPMGSFGGALRSLSATQLGALAIKGAIEKARIEPAQVTDVFMGSVLQANLGQAPARPYANLNLEHGSPAYQATHAYIKTATSTSSI